jgi:hypothetical protein
VLKDILPGENFMRLVLKILAIIVITVFAHSYSSADVAVNITSDPTAELIKRLLVEVNRPLSEIPRLTNEIRKVEKDYNINPILLIAVMEEELKFKGFPEAHVYTYNVDNGIVAPVKSPDALPSPYSDVDCVARALVNQIETFNGDLETSVAAYFFGTPTMKHHGVEELDETGKKILENVIQFIRDHPDERREGAPIRSTVEPKIAKPVKSISRAGIKRSSGSAIIDGEFKTREEKYIAVMRHFNKKLDKESASEIYWSIAAMNSEYPHVDARLVMALFAVESSFRPDAVSHKGAQGLGQLMPYTADSLNVDDPFDCSENVKGTFIYLDREIRRFADKQYPLDLVLAAYNAGPEAVKKYDYTIPPYKETQNYVRKVINIYSQLLKEEEKEEKLRGKTRYYNLVRR